MDPGADCTHALLSRFFGKATVDMLADGEYTILHFVDGSNLLTVYQARCTSLLWLS